MFRRVKSDEELFIRYGADIANAVQSCYRDEGSDPASTSAHRFKWASLLRQMQRLGRFSSGNSVDILETGDVALPAMIEAIDAACDRVWLETYILDSSCSTQPLISALKRAAERGVDVVALIDYCGSMDFVQQEELESSGVKVVVFNPPFFASGVGVTVGPINFRDHRKILVADEIGFCGSMNIHKDTLKTIQNQPFFYDVHLKLTGPCVWDLADVFCGSLAESEGPVQRSFKRPDTRIKLSDSIVSRFFTRNSPPQETTSNGVYVQVFESNVRKENRSIQRSLAALIRNADSNLIIASSYFTPPGFLKREIDKALARSIPTSLLVSGESDLWPIPGDLLGQTHAIRRFALNPACDVRMYSQQHMHAKFLCVDSVYSAFGSFNFDRWSARRNLEVVVGIMDKDISKQLERIHSKIAQRSYKTTEHDWWFKSWISRGVCATAYWCVKLTGKNLVDGLDSYQREWRIRKAAVVDAIHKHSAENVAINALFS